MKGDRYIMKKKGIILFVLLITVLMLGGCGNTGKSSGQSDSHKKSKTVTKKKEETIEITLNHIKCASSDISFSKDYDLVHDELNDLYTLADDRGNYIIIECLSKTQETSLESEIVPRYWSYVYCNKYAYSYVSDEIDTKCSEIFSGEREKEPEIVSVDDIKNDSLAEVCKYSYSDEDKSLTFYGYFLRLKSSSGDSSPVIVVLAGIGSYDIDEFMKEIDSIVDTINVQFD